MRLLEAIIYIFMVIEFCVMLFKDLINSLSEGEGAKRVEFVQPIRLSTTV